MHEVLALARHRLAAHAAQPERCCWRSPALVGVYLLLWRSRPGYALRAVGSRARGGAVRRHRAAARRSCCAMALSGALAGAGGHQRDRRRARPAAARLRRRRRLRRHRGGADRAQPPAGHRAGGAAVRRAVPGRRRAGFEIQGFSRDMVFTLQGLIVLFCRRDGAGGRAVAGARLARAAPAAPRCAGGRAWMRCCVGTLLASTLRVATPLILCALAGAAVASAPASSTSASKARCCSTAFAAAARRRGQRLAAAGARRGHRWSAWRCRCCTASPASATAATRWCRAWPSR